MFKKISSIALFGDYSYSVITRHLRLYCMLIVCYLLHLHAYSVSLGSGGDRHRHPANR